MKPSKSFELTLSKISYTFVIIALTFTLALLRYEITFMVIILGAILNVVAIIFSFQHGYFGGAFSFLAHTSGGIANLVMFIDMPNFFFLSVAIFSFSNILVCIFMNLEVKEKLN
jgi:hypothetical protein